jgi:hypothetical protein
LLRSQSESLPTTIALEVLAPEHEEMINKAKTPSQWRVVKEALQLEKHWGSSFETYQEIFQLCVRKKIKIIGLRSLSPKLQTRDRFAANRLKDQVGPVWILMGEFHCTPSHLPHLLRGHKVVLQQNIDSESLKRMADWSVKKSLYLRGRSQKRGLGTTDLFCLLHTPPWVKWQSYWEHQQRIMDSTVESEPLQALDQVRWSLKTLHHYLEDPRYPLSYTLNELLAVDVVTPEDPRFYRWMKNVSSQQRRLITQQLKHSHCAVLLKQKRLFLRETTLNSCAHGAATYMVHMLTQETDAPLDFFKATYAETLSFFLSKILNHSRRALSWVDWKQQGKTPEARAVLQSASFPLRYADRKRWLKNLRPHEAAVRVHLARILADAAFEAFLTGEFSKARLQRLMTEPVLHSEQAFEKLVELKSVGAAFSPSRSQR